MRKYKIFLAIASIFLVSCGSYDYELEFKNYSINKDFDEVQAEGRFINTDANLQKHLLQLPGGGTNCKNELGEIIQAGIGRLNINENTTREDAKVVGIIRLCGNHSSVNCEPIKFKLKRYTFKCESYFTNIFHDLHKVKKPFTIDFDTRNIKQER